jgi:hypothetical protein
MAAIYSNGGNPWNILGFNFTKRDALSSVYKISMVGQHPLVVRLMKGVSISRPPQPRYQHTWDVSVLTTYLTTIGDNSGYSAITLKQLSQKLCMLMALTCPERSSVMASLDIIITYMRFYPEGNLRELRESVYPKFTDESLCPVTCLTEYLKRTKEWRQKNDKLRFFLSFICLTN